MTPEEIQQLARTTIEQEAASVAALAGQIGDSFVEAATLLLNCKGHVLVAGSGTSSSVAARLAHLLSCSGTPALFIHPGDSQHGLAGAVTERDVLIAISKGGETVEVNFLTRLAKRRGARVIALTEKADSTLARQSHVVLCVKSLPNVDPHGMIATGSSLTNAALGDALCVVMLRLRNYSVEEFGETHPGGAVGHRLRKSGQGGQG